ncbi:MULTISPECIES: winged helix-turn-helix domain-containing protein [Holzapfeliella]
MRLLMVEDNVSVAQMMEMFFEKEQWVMDLAVDGNEAVDKFKANQEYYDIVTLDLNLPGKDGMEVAREIRAVSDVPIIMLTARDSESDQVLGLELGADDYVTKPFSPLTLIARIKALHRRTLMNQTTKPADTEDMVETPHLKINEKTREVYVDDQKVQGLTPKEFDLLVTMAKNPKQVFSREKLLEVVWGYEYFGEERTVDAHIKKLRQKIEKIAPQIIQTVWGVGYKFDDSDVDK